MVDRFAPRTWVGVELQTWIDLKGHHRDELAHADLLFVGGGNAFRLLHHVRRHGFEQAVRDFVAGGGDYYGGSAGVILACADIGVAACLDQNEMGLTDLTGLGLSQEFAVLPHYDDGQLMAAREWSSDHELARRHSETTTRSTVPPRAMGDDAYSDVGLQCRTPLG